MNDMNDIPSNSLKSQQTPKKETSKPPVPVFDGQTAGIQRKNKGAFGKWLRRMLLSDRKPKDIIKEVVEYRIVPGFKDNVRNSALAALDGFIYSGSSPAASNTSQNGVNYNRMFNNTAAPSSVPPAQNNQNEDEKNKGFNNPCFRSQTDAMTFLTMMKEYDYPTLSVHTLYMMQKKHIDFTWDAYGWNREEIQRLTQGCIRHINNTDWPWMIDLPTAHVIA